MWRTPVSVLRNWTEEIPELTYCIFKIHTSLTNVSARYAPDARADAFCGRAPTSVLARRYTDFSPDKLRERFM